MRLSELTAQVDGDPELMIEGQDGIPIPISRTDAGVMYVPGVGVVPYLLLEAPDEMAAMPPAWADLIEGLTLLAKHHTDPISPLHCSHDTLHVLANDNAFTAEEIDRLDALGFNVDSAEGGFYSYRFGSA